MNIALNSRGEIVVDNFSDAFEIYATSHNFCRDHDPGFTSFHPTYRIFAFLLRHPGVKAIHPRNPTENKLFGERRCTNLCRGEYQNWGIIRLSEGCQKGW